jgi:hypothetical protein
VVVRVRAAAALPTTWTTTSRFDRDLRLLRIFKRLRVGGEALARAASSSISPCLGSQRRYKKGRCGAKLEVVGVRYCKNEDTYTRAGGLSLA